MPQRSSSSIPPGAVYAAVACIAVGAAVLVYRAHSSDSSTASPAASASGESLAALLGSASPEPSLDPSQPKGQILSKSSLVDAIAVARPFMTNTAGRLDTGSALLSLWAAEHLTWSAIEALPETSPALFRKDPDAERGKRFCITGAIVEIRAEKTLAGRIADDRAAPLIERPTTPTIGLETSGIPPTPAPSDSSGPSLFGLAPTDSLASIDWTLGGGAKVYFAIVKEKPEPMPTDGTGSREARRASQKDALVVELIAVRSSGALVDGSDARACGVLTGVTTPASNAGGASDTPEHRIVGMFDLPENHAGAELAHHGG